MIFLMCFLIFFSIIYPVVSSQEEGRDLIIDKVDINVINALENNTLVEVFIKIEINNISSIDRVLSSLDESEFKLIKRSVYNDAFSGNISKKGVEKIINNPDVRGMYLNRVAKVTLQDSTPLINATTVWNSLGYTGRGQTVCVIDTGINWSHPDLGGCAYTDNINDGSCSKVIGGYDFYNLDDDPMDDYGIYSGNPYGHGTHVAGIVAANGTIKGVAPDAKLVALKACSWNYYDGCTDLAVQQSIKWCVNHSQEYNISIISMSFGGGDYNDETCLHALDDEFNLTHSSNISVVISSGNDGFIDGISWPACSPNVTSVGATTKSDSISDFSNRGPNLDLLAPGEEINSTSRSGGYVSMDGTSMAAPHVVGVIALMLEKNKNLTPDELLFKMKQSGKIIYDSVSGLNFSRVNAYNAITNRIIFMTNKTFNGSLGGTSGADLLCMNDSNKPAISSSSIYKALLGTGNRYVSGNDWVLRANTTYKRANTTITVGYTNSQKWFIFSLSNPISNISKDVWTGLRSNGNLSEYNCSQWTSSSNSLYGMTGLSTSSTSSSIERVEKICDSLRPLYCVEQ